MPPPLQGRRVVITRTPEQAGELSARLSAAGAEAILLPTIEIAAPENWAPLDAALRQLDVYQGFIFTSANAVTACFERARQLELAMPTTLMGAGPGAPPQRASAPGTPASPRHPLDGPAPLGKRGPAARPGRGPLQPQPGSRAWVCAVGPATAAALEERGWRATIVPEEHRAEGVVLALDAGEPKLAGCRILFPRAAAGRDVIPAALAERGAEVDLVDAYRTQPAEGSRAQAQKLFPAAGPAGADAVVLTSSSTARNLAQLLGDDYRARLAGVTLAAIGPVTRATAEGMGLKVEVESAAATSADLVAALIEHWHA